VSQIGFCFAIIKKLFSTKGLISLKNFLLASIIIALNLGFNGVEFNIANIMLRI
jgi:hypothetical protein